MKLLLIFILLLQYPIFESPTYKKFNSWQSLQKDINDERMVVVLICTKDCFDCKIYSQVLRSKASSYRFIDIYEIEAEKVDNDIYKKGDLVPALYIFIAGYPIDYKPTDLTVDKNYIDIDEIDKYLYTIAKRYKFIY